VSDLPSGLAERVADEESLIRAIVSSGWVVPSKGRIKYPAFLPNGDHETSVTRADRLTNEQLWRFAQDAAGARNLHGVGRVKASVVRLNSLEVLSSEPPEYHANIVNWPQDADPEEEKARRVEIAREIALATEFIPHPVA